MVTRNLCKYCVLTLTWLLRLHRALIKKKFLIHEYTFSWIFVKYRNIIKNLDFNDLDSCTSLGGINIRMLGFVIQVSIYTF